VTAKLDLHPQSTSSARVLRAAGHGAVLAQHPHALSVQSLLLEAVGAGGAIPGIVEDGLHPLAAGLGGPAEAVAVHQRLPERLVQRRRAAKEPARLLARDEPRQQELLRALW
jgi:hypothetical protein